LDTQIGGISVARMTPVISRPLLPRRREGLLLDRAILSASFPAALAGVVRELSQWRSKF
jgi:hypothetical protein